MNESTQVDKIEEGFYAVEYEENKFVEIRLPQKADVIFHFETIIRTKADYARSGFRGFNFHAVAIKGRWGRNADVNVCLVKSDKVAGGSSFVPPEGPL